MTVWFTADTHFGSERTLELSRRPFESVEKMDDAIILGWLTAFQPGDVLYHLGDFGDFETGLPWLRFRHVECHLVLGNYEQEAIEKGELTKEQLLEMGFASVQDSVNVREIMGARAVHRPSDCDKKHFNVFGHIHGRQTVKRYGIDVGVDAHHFRPISAEDVLWYRDAIENSYDDEVFE